MDHIYAHAILRAYQFKQKKWREKGKVVSIYQSLYIFGFSRTFSCATLFEYLRFYISYDSFNTNYSILRIWTQNYSKKAWL